jgi:membrane dipeptidase
VSIVIDAHEDIAWNVLAHGRDYLQGARAIRQREAGGPDEAAAGQAMLGLPEWLAGGVAVVFGTIFTLPDRSRTGSHSLSYKTPNEAHVLGMREIDIYHRMADQAPQFKLIKTQAELESVLKTWADFDPNNPSKGLEKRRVGCVILMENGDPIRTPDEVPMWYERGLRLIGPAWASSRYCGGTGEPGPLTDEGVKLLKVMNDLNMILDLTHMDEQAYFQALDRFDGPIIASHSNARVFTAQTNRHLTDEMIKGLIDHDGVIGTVIFNKFLLPDWNTGDPKNAATVQTVVERIDYVCQKAGDARHAAIGTDFDGGYGAASTPAGFDTVADLKIIGPALAEKGYSASDVDLILNGNWQRMLRRSLPA